MPKTKTEREKIRNEHDDSWIAVDAGDTISGKIVDVTDAWSDQRRNPETGRPGSMYPLITIYAMEATGYGDLPKELKVHCFGAVLFNEIMRKQPNLREEIRITYTGPGEAKPNQNPPELYTVRVGGDGGSAQRAYAKIGGGGSGGATAQPVQGTLPGAGADDDIPF